MVGMDFETGHAQPLGRTREKGTVLLCGERQMGIADDRKWLSGHAGVLGEAARFGKAEARRSNARPSFFYSFLFR